MKPYWDSCSLIDALYYSEVRKKLIDEGGVTRSHTLCEIFSTLTGGKLGERVDATVASEMIAKLVTKLDVVDIDHTEVLEALSQTRMKGVRGGRVYDYIHAFVANKCECSKIYTSNIRDFADLFPAIEIVKP